MTISMRSGAGVWLCAGLMLLLFSFSAPVRATFKDPLDTPALLSPLAQSTRLTAVEQAGSRLVAVGARGHILLSDDAGQTWSQTATPVSSDLVALHFPTPQQGWATGHDGVVLHTADGGRSWVKQLDGKMANKAMRDYAEKLRHAGTPLPASVEAEIKRFVEEGADKPFLDVHFLNENEGFIVGAFNLALRTRDGGRSWEPLLGDTDNPEGMHLYALASAGGVLYMVGEKGLVRRWNRESQRFDKLITPYEGSYFGILAKDSILIVFGLRGNAYRSRDGGATWQKLETGTTAGITKGIKLQDGRIALVTQGGKILVTADQGDSFQSIQAAQPMSYFGAAPASADAIAVVGPGGVRLEKIR